MTQEHNQLVSKNLPVSEKSIDDLFQLGQQFFDLYAAQTQRWLTGFTLTPVKPISRQPAMFDELFKFNKNYVAVSESASILAFEMTQYQFYLGVNCFDSWQRILAKGGSRSDYASGDFKSFTDDWLVHFNEEMLNILKSDEFLQRQSSLAQATASMQASQRSLMDELLQKLDMPTQSEVEELGRSMYQIRKELRKLKREIRACEGKLNSKQDQSDSTETLAWSDLGSAKAVKIKPIQPMPTIFPDPNEALEENKHDESSRLSTFRRG